MDNDDAYDCGLEDVEASTVRAQGPPAPQSASGGESSFDDPDTDFYALYVPAMSSLRHETDHVGHFVVSVSAMSMEESPQKPQVSAYNPTQGVPSLRATTTTPGAGPPARPPPRPSAARTPGRQRRGEEEEDEEEPTVALEVAPQVHQNKPLCRSKSLQVTHTPSGMHLSLWQGVGWVCDGLPCSVAMRRKQTAPRHAVQSWPPLHSYGQRHQLPPLRRQRSQQRDFGRPC